MSFASPLPFPSSGSTLPQPQVPSTPPNSSTNRGCCENGRPVLTDPATGQSVCSCQYSSALLGYSRLPGLSGPLFSPPSYSPGAPAPSPGYGVGLGGEGSAFYAPLTGGGQNLRDTTEAWRSLTQSPLYDTSAMGFYPYGGYGGLDLNARRKNATRESTNTLKAWLHEHIKNPYPTKGEKIMLAIITKMTLTQVSTWFANARRRLKKENKMTWSPRNRSEDGEDDDDDEDGADEKTEEGLDKEKRLSSCGEDIDVDGSPTKTHHRPATTKQNHNNNTTTAHNHNTNTPESDSTSPAPSIGEDSRSRLSPPHSRDSDPGSFRLNGHTTPSELDPEHLHKPKIWSVTDFLHPGSHRSGGGVSEPSSCRETGMKMDIMRCVPTSAEAAAVDLTGRTVGGGVSGSVSASAVAAHAHAQHAAAALSVRGPPGAGFLPPMTSLSTAQQLSSYQNALVSYAATHSSPYSPYALASAEMNKFVMKPTATRFSPYGVGPKQGIEPPFPPVRDFSALREGE